MRALLLLAALGAPAAAYEAVPGTHANASIGGRLVRYKTTDADSSARWSPGIQLRVPLSPDTLFELSADRVRYTSAGASVRAYPVQATLIGHFAPRSPASPYLLLGVGWYPTSYDGPGSSPHRLFGPHAGGGLEMALGPDFSLDASFRYLWTQSFAALKPHRLFGRDFSERGTMITAALNRRF